MAYEWNPQTRSPYDPDYAKPAVMPEVQTAVQPQIQPMVNQVNEQLAKPAVQPYNQISKPLAPIGDYNQKLPVQPTPSFMEQVRPTTTNPQLSYAGGTPGFNEMGSGSLPQLQPAVMPSMPGSTIGMGPNPYSAKLAEKPTPMTGSIPANPIAADQMQRAQVQPFQPPGNAYGKGGMQQQRPPGNAYGKGGAPNQLSPRPVNPQQPVNPPQGFLQQMQGSQGMNRMGQMQDNNMGMPPQQPNPYANMMSAMSNRQNQMQGNGKGGQMDGYQPPNNIPRPAPSMQGKGGMAQQGGYQPPQPQQQPMSGKGGYSRPQQPPRYGKGG